MTRISPNVFVQREGESLYLACERSHHNTRQQHRFLHILNPFPAPPDSDETKIQQLTLHTAGMARSLVAPGVVNLVAVTFPGEAIPLPPSFTRLEGLHRSVLDVGKFKVARRLPLLFDVVASGLTAARDEDYIVFTNVDICLMPYFYGSLQRMLNLGFESLIINRRTIQNYGLDPQLLPIMFADPGQTHEGFDCFVFPRRLYERFVRSNVCVGAPDVMRALLFNLVALSENVLILQDSHFTFHLGDDKSWAKPELLDYLEHNRRCSYDVLAGHSQDQQRRSLLQSFCIAHQENYSVP